MLVFAIGGIWEYFFVRKGSRRRIVTLIVLLIASLVVLVNQYLTNKQHDLDTGQVSALTTAVQKANDTQQANAKEFTAEQQAARTEFLQRFTDLSGKVSKLQTEAATEALQKQAQQLQADLAATQKALDPPKARLEFSFETPPGADPIRSLSLNRDPGDNYTLRFTVANLTDAAAVDGDIIFHICNNCTFVKEPAQFRRLEGEGPTERNCEFARILPQSRLNTFETTIHVLPQYTQFNVGINYRCKTCIIPPVVNGQPPATSLGTVYIAAVPKP